jgi:hypothetical protein
MCCNVKFEEQPRQPHFRSAFRGAGVLNFFFRMRFARTIYRQYERNSSHCLDNITDHTDVSVELIHSVQYQFPNSDACNLPNGVAPQIVNDSGV